LRRAAHLCRSWLFVDGADEQALLTVAPQSGADVLVQELEDFTPPQLLGKARAMAPDVLSAWRAAGITTAVRVNPLATSGMDDLAAIMRGAPDIVALPKVGELAHVVRLEEAVSRFEREYGLDHGSTALWPNIELARGLVQTAAIVRASRRIEACLMASEDLAADLGAERGQDGAELAYARQRFLVECVAAGVVAVDCPYTWRDPEGVERDTLWARRLGYKAKSAVAPEHADIINRVLTPSEADVEHARLIVAQFDAARAQGLSRIEVAGSLVELPIYLNAKRLLARAKELGETGRSR
jgi:citrate lyase subunit beta/citryl-CoA lyase